MSYNRMMEISLKYKDIKISLNILKTTLWIENNNIIRNAKSYYKVKHFFNFNIFIKIDRGKI